MKIGDLDFFEASKERLKDAKSMYEAANRGEVSYAASLYLHGLAVECLGRAFRAKLDLPFDDKHDLRKLLSKEVEGCH